MSAVHVEYAAYDTIRIPFWALEGVRRAIQKEAPKLFSVEELALNNGDFSFKWLPADHPLDLLTHDIIVRLQLHHFPERVQDCDAKALQLAERISVLIRGQFSVGVSLLLAEIGWGAVAVDDSNVSPLSKPSFTHID